MEKDVCHCVRARPCICHSLQLWIKGGRWTGEDDGCVLSSVNLSGH